MLNFLERPLVIFAAVSMGFAYTPAAGFATLIALDIMLDIRRSLEGKQE